MKIQFWLSALSSLTVIVAPAMANDLDMGKILKQTFTGDSAFDCAVSAAKASLEGLSVSRRLALPTNGYFRKAGSSTKYWWYLEDAASHVQTAYSLTIRTNAYASLEGGRTQPIYRCSVQDLGGDGTAVVYLRNEVQNHALTSLYTNRINYLGFNATYDPRWTTDKQEELESLLKN